MVTPPFPSGPFNLILCDPPWQFRDRANAGKRGAAHKYPCMGWRDIARLPVPSIAAGDCMLAMWWVDTMADEALRIVDMWGFGRVKMTGFTWAKLTALGAPHFGMGHWSRGNAENCLFAFRGKPQRASASVSQLIISPVREHSQKPPEARDRLVQLLGDIPRIELFARDAAPGWDAWGNEIST